MMSREQRQQLREAATHASHGRFVFVSDADPGPWKLQTSNSFRRIGTRGDGDVLCAVTHRSDGHPDLQAPPGVLDYIVAAQPLVVLDLLDQLDAAEQLLSRLAEVEDRMDKTDREFREAQVLIERMRIAAGLAVTGGGG